MTVLDPQNLDRMIADGKITEEDAHAVRTFADYLKETPPGSVRLTAAELVTRFPDRAAFEAWRSRWLPYMAGLTDGPTTPEEYAGHLPALRARRR